jgi:hypothetical protein
MMEAVGSSETLVPVHQVTRPCIPKDNSIFHFLEFLVTQFRS